jgi:hypothetical protein
VASSTPWIEQRWNEAQRPALAALQRRARQDRLPNITYMLEVWHEMFQPPEQQRHRLARNCHPIIDIDTLLYGHCPGFELPGTLPEATLHAAMARVIARLNPRRLRNPRADKELRHQAAERGVSPAALLRTYIFPQAICLVCTAAATPQRMRVGRQWLTDREHKVLIAAPVEQPVSMDVFVRWFYAQIRRVACIILLDAEYPQTSPGLLPLLGDGEDAVERRADRQHYQKMMQEQQDSAPLTGLLDDTLSVDHLEPWLADVPPRMRQLLRLFLQGVPRKAQAQRLGLSRSTVDNHWFRFKHRYSRHTKRSLEV